MWKSLEEEVTPGSVTKYKITENQKILNFKEAIKLLQTSIDFRKFIIDLLKVSSFEGFFWEVKPITINKMNEKFEFVIVNSTILPRINANKSSFEEHFINERLVVSFPNLRGDAKLIVPTEMSEGNNYGHLAKFIRNAPENQVDKFWQIVGKEYENLINEKPRWLSTAGLGVPWLHVRIDTRPKYYRYSPYKTIN